VYHAARRDVGSIHVADLPNRCECADRCPGPAIQFIGLPDQPVTRISRRSSPLKGVLPAPGAGQPGFELVLGREEPELVTAVGLGHERAQGAAAGEVAGDIADDRQA
jgi:hypothetical protein